MRDILITILLLVGCATCSKGVSQTLPFGPNQCKAGFVFREAWTNDQTCVSPDTRKQVASDNATANQHIAPGPFGPDQCRNTLVWRNARPTDHVCVSLQQRDQARTDNYYDFSRKQMRLVNHDKPTPPPSNSTGIKSDGDAGGFHPGAAGLSECKSRFQCPPRMQASFEGDVCTCSSR